MLADSVGLAMLVVLGSLRPDERLAFVLHDMFAVPFAEIGQILDRSGDAVKMLASRARRKVQDVPPPAGDRRRKQEQREVVDAFWPPHATVTSTRCCVCWTPTSVGSGTRPPA